MISAECHGQTDGSLSRHSGDLYRNVFHPRANSTRMMGTMTNHAGSTKPIAQTLMPRAATAPTLPPFLSDFHNQYPATVLNPAAERKNETEDQDPCESPCNANRAASKEIAERRRHSE